MKITDIRLMDPVYIPVQLQQDAINTLGTVSSPIFCQIFTDEGVTGIVPARGGNFFKALVEDVLKPYVIGEDPMNNERIWSKMYWGTLGSGRRGAILIAISMIDNAVWDLKGRITKQPIHKLLGGYRDAVNSYGSGINLNLTSDELVKQMTDFVKDGFKLVKMKIGSRDTRVDIERVRLVREAIGPDIDLCLDVNNGWSLSTAIEMTNRLEEYDIYWLEEPILADEFDSLAKLAKETRIPIAIGENHYTRWEFKQIIEQGAVEILQPDIGKCGGVTEFLKIAAMADAFGLPVCPHFSAFVDVPCIAAVPNGLFHEYVKIAFDASSKLLKEHVQPLDGMIAPLNKPGFGIELDPDALKKFSTKLTSAPRGSIRGWRWPPYL
ncbi:MAG: mandelate racemase/muconate lactonizing enzyme family protein [Chloroflexota bacterium]